MSETEALHQALDANPDDWLTRKVLADAYADEGDDLAAECLRWTASARKRPRPHADEHQWYNARDNRYGYDPESDLPEPLYQKLTGGTLAGSGYRRYATRRLAEQDLMRAWKQARASGWRPHA
jgi:hypothetical protein